MTVVSEIVKNKKIQVAKDKEKKSSNIIKKIATDIASTRSENFRFQEKLKDKTSTKLISEFKPASPSKGDISSLSIENVIGIYDEYDADMISILTEESFFKGSIDNLSRAVGLTDKPILRKDFFIDEYMIYQAVAHGASAVLLINGVCPDMEGYLNLCADLGVDAIVECHTKQDLDDVIDLDPKIIGVNNRNFTDLSIDLNTTKQLAKYIPNYMISESGVRSTDDAKLLKSYGADALLIGTAILESNSEDKIGRFIKQLKETLKN
ncbi:MAG: indole-3-glycerol-phosphate synthase [Methanosphaera sp.]|uniref:indole-3-glycerol phosphate synthase TrpC n=1 Tax=Methanosphaera sp. TaxID=2666342 RepID=UPI0025D35FCD|nr:indole-3-glycerol-phosphate synthase [Methanosphaera sp.]MCI5867164.1 indole-3-glycerol-phosphate synthase [Methanosphaera sp.]MDD6534768.1 indole-3-glycerol-phosphate synthase [Methanosphaera sp.]MDY3955564.1 indole-3-glycerol-phosphate synthase [Methanosphaera sp.]